MGRRSKLLWGFVLIIGLVSCGEEKGNTESQNAEDPKKQEELKTAENVFEDLSEEGIKKKIIGFISKNEDHFLSDSSFQFFRGKMNHDDVDDWVVAVNELEYAKKKLNESGNMTAIDYGYLGNYNHLFVIDGATGKWNGRPIGSSALRPLEIEIDFINSDQYQLAKIFYRVGTSKFVAIFNSSIPSFQEIFKWEIYNLSDTKNNGQPTAKVIEFEGMPNQKKKILVYEGAFANFSDEALVEDLFGYEPEIKKASLDPLHTFEYQLTEGKYGEIQK